MKIQVQHFFDAMHQLSDSEDLVTKQCHNYHGHTYKVIVEVEGKNNRHGMVVDFKAIKNVIDRFDHTAILKLHNPLIRPILETVKTQKIIVLAEEPTAENIAYYLGILICHDLKFKKCKVSICEGYKGEDKASWAIAEVDMSTIKTGEIKRRPLLV